MFIRAINTVGVKRVAAALLLSGGATIGFGYFFGATRLPAQMLMTAILAGTTALLLIVIVILDRPFAGAGRIAPAAFAELFERWRALGY